MFKQTKIASTWLALATLLAAGSASAQTNVLTTGAPGTSDVGGYSLDSNDWIDGQISLSGPQTITSIQAFLDNPFGAAGDNFDIVLYSDNGSNQLGKQLFSGTASYNGTTGWNGLSNLNWAVTGGTYWVGLQVSGDEGTNFVATTGAPTLLTNTAFSANGGANYVYRNVSGKGLSSDMDFGLTVTSVAAVPEANEWMMMLLGLGVVGAIASRRKGQAAPTSFA